MRSVRTTAARSRLAELAGAGLPWEPYAHRVLDLLAGVVPYDTAAFATVDPATGLLTACVDRDMVGRDDAVFARHEYVEDSVNLIADLASRRVPVGVLGGEAGGDPGRSSRFREFFLPVLSLGHEVRAVLRSDGATWGAVALYRTVGGPGFGPAETAFLADVAPVVARGLCAGLVVAQAGEDGSAGGAVDPEGPAVLLVDGAGELTEATPAALAALAALGAPPEGPLPMAVRTLIARAGAEPAARGAAGISVPAPRLRVRSPDGRWFTVRAARMTGAAGSERTVVSLEPSHPSEVVSLLVEALGLTERETQVVRAVIEGRSTRQIADALHLSAYTVQDHLKAVFEKAGVRSRRELVARLFFDHQAPAIGGPLQASGALRPRA